MPITSSTLHHNAPSSPSQAALPHACSSRLGSDNNDASGGAADFVTPQKTKIHLQGDAAMQFSSLVDQRNEGGDEKELQNLQVEQPIVASRRRDECFLHADLRSCEDIAPVDGSGAVRNNNNNNNDASVMSRSSHHSPLLPYSEYMATEFVTAAGRPICIVRRSHCSGEKGSANVTTTGGVTSANSSAARGLAPQPDALPLDPAAAAAAREGAFFVTSSASEASDVRSRDELALAAMPKHNEKRRLSLMMPPLRWLDAPRHVDNCDSSHQDQEEVEDNDADTQGACVNHDDGNVVATPFAAAGRWKRPRAASDSDLGGGHDCCDDVYADATAALTFTASPHDADGEATTSPPRHLNIAAHFSGFTTAKGVMIYLADPS
jgi:hypothetical protein